MTLKIYTLIIVSAAMTAVAQILMKVGMESTPIQQALEGSYTDWNLYRVMLFDPSILFALFLYAVGTILWLFVLAEIDVSLAYPWVGLAVVLTMLMGIWFLGEPLTAARVFGTLLVVAGITLISAF